MRMIVKTLCKLDELSLNPVLVSICWQVLLFLELDVEIEFSHTLILGLSVWMAYSADRFCEHLLIILPCLVATPIGKIEKKYFTEFGFRLSP